MAVTGVAAVKKVEVTVEAPQNTEDLPYIYPDEYEEDDTIIDSLQGYPCAQEILAKMPNLNVEVAKIIKETFGESIKNNLIYKPGVLIGKDGECNSVLQGYGRTNYSWTVEGNIILNEDLLKYGTQEIILSTMIHEGLHAFIELERNRLSYNDFMAKYGAFGAYHGSEGRFSFYLVSNGHMQMISFIEKIESAIRDFNPALPNYVVEALARYGLITNDFPQDIINLINNERDTRKKQISWYKM